MRGLRISFSPTTGPVFDFSSPLVDFDTTVQNAMVNLGTETGSDIVFADRGTSLILDAVQGRMVNTVWANQSCNFAALKVLSFSQDTELQSNPFKLQNLSLVSVNMVNQSSLINVQATCVDGTVEGQTVSM